MPGITRYPSTNINYTLFTFIDSPDSVYGSGADGSATCDGTTSVAGMTTTSSTLYTLSRDVFFYNLTINSGITVNPNGYRIFVKNLLTLSNASVIGYTTGFSTAGSIKQGGSAATSVTNSLGGNALSTYTATAPTSLEGGTQYWQQPTQAVLGYSVTAGAAATPNYVRGGAGGTGQAGGGVVILAARYIDCTATSTNAKISAAATSPAGGGVILLVSTGAGLPSNVSTDVTGANSGTYNYMQLV